MAANTNPIFTLTPNVGSVLVTAANTSSQGGGTVGTDIFLAFTSGTNGSWVEKIRLIPTGTAPTNTTASVGRAFISSVGSGATTSANTFLIAEVQLPVIAADNSATIVPWLDIWVGAFIAASRFILVTNHAAPAANTAWRAVVFGGDY